MDEDPLDRTMRKLVQTKRLWAEQGRLLTGEAGARGRDRLPPGQRLVQGWPVLDLGVRPEIARADWRLAVDGLVERPLALDWDALMALPQAEATSDVHCVTAWSRYDNRWRGVTASTLLEAVGPKPEARHVLFESYDGYTTNVTLEAFAAPDVLLAHAWDGRPLAPEHGGPLRVVIPALYFWKSAKWVRRITVSAEDRPGFWEVRGYHNEADPWTEQRYS